MPLNFAKVGLMLVVLIGVGLIIWNIILLSHKSTRTLFAQVSTALHGVIVLIALVIYYNAARAFT